MQPRIKRLITALALATAPLVLIAAAGLASAAQPDVRLVRPGVYNGLWHGDKVKFIILKVHGDGSFSGDIHFDPNGRYPNFRCGFTARLGNNNSLTMTRDDCAQTAVTGRPDLYGNTTVWRGSVALDNNRYAFEMRIPR
jgi:hypothetical protein